MRQKSYLNFDKHIIDHYKIYSNALRAMWFSEGLENDGYNSASEVHDAIKSDFFLHYVCPRVR